MANNSYPGAPAKKKNSDKMLIGIGAAIIAVIILIATVLIVMLSGKNNTSEQHDYIDLANQYLEQMDYSNAVKTYWAAIEKSPNNVEYYLQLGSIYEEMDKREAACTVYEMGYQRTMSQTLFHKWNDTKQLLTSTEVVGGDKAEGAPVDRRLLLNTTFGDKLAVYTYKDYLNAYGTPTVTLEGQKYAVTYSGINAVFYYYNSSENLYAVDTLSRKPRETSRPNEILLNDLSLVFSGMTDKMSLADLGQFGLSDLRVGTDSHYGKTVLLFRYMNAVFEIECDSEGSFKQNAWCLIIPAKANVVQETTTEPESTTASGAEPLTSVTTTVPETTTEPQRFFSISGTIVNAVDAVGIPGVKVTLTSTSTNSFEPRIVYTDNRGEFTFTDVPDGFAEYKIALKCDGFEDDSETFSRSSADGDTVHLELVMSPVLQTGEIRFVLTWNDTPRDLDSHLEGSSSSGRSVHVYFSNRRVTDASGTIAELDVDDRDGVGPETTTLYDMGGTYHFYVVDFGNTGTMGVNGATVKIYVNGQSPIVLDVPTDVRNRWNVCTVQGGVVRTENTAGD